MLGHVVHIPKKILLMYGVFNDRHRGITKAVFPKVYEIRGYSIYNVADILFFQYSGIVSFKVLHLIKVRKL